MAGMADMETELQKKKKEKKDQHPARRMAFPPSQNLAILTCS
jgi:hypothetical protein